MNISGLIILKQKSDMKGQRIGNLDQSSRIHHISLKSLRNEPKSLAKERAYLGDQDQVSSHHLQVQKSLERNLRHLQQTVWPPRKGDQQGKSIYSTKNYQNLGKELPRYEENIDPILTN